MNRSQNIKTAIKQMFAKRFFRVTGTVSLILLILIALLPIWQLLPEIQEQVAIPLHYNIHFGVDWYGAWLWIFAIPLIGLIVFLLNFILSITMWGKDKVLSHFLWASTAVSEFILLVAITFVVLLNLTYI